MSVSVPSRERDELMDHVTSLQSQLQQMSHREEEAYQQMKKGIQLVEQAQLERTEVMFFNAMFSMILSVMILLSFKKKKNYVFFLCDLLILYC